MEHSNLSFTGEGHKQSPPSSRGGLGAPFACAGLQSREGGIGLDSRSCSCSPPGCLSPCPVSGPARIKHNCSQPRNCQGMDSIPPHSIGNPACSVSHPHRCSQMQTVRARALPREFSKRATDSRLSLRKLVGTAQRGGSGWTSPLGVSSGTPAGTSQPSSDREEILCNN